MARRLANAAGVTIDGAISTPYDDSRNGMISSAPLNSQIVFPMAKIGKWIASTLLLAGLMSGIALILLLLATPLSEALNKRYRIDDDWALLALPVGGIVGLLLGVRYRDRIWLRCLSVVMFVLVIGLIISCSIPMRAPDSVPDGMNRLPYGLGNMLRKALLQVALVSGGVSLAAAAAAISILSLFPQRSVEPDPNNGAPDGAASRRL